MLKSTNRNPNSAALIALKPRQVLLAEHRTKAITMSKKQSKTQTLNPEQKTSLLHSVIKFLEKSGFSKTLKRILSEAQIENEEWKVVSVDLEDVYCKYFDTSNHDETTVSTIQKEEVQTELTTKDNGKSDYAVSEDLTKKKKKKRIERENVNAADQSEVLDNKITNTTKKSEELLDVNILSEPVKTKGKKKSKKGSDKSDENKPIQSLETSGQVENTVSHDNGVLNDKTKDKKKKKSKSNNVDQEQIDSVKLVVEEQSENLASAAGDTKKEEKSSKKRKRSISEENENQPDDNETSEKSKLKKSKGSEKSKKEKPAIIDGCEKIEKDHKLLGNIESTKMSKKELDDDENGELGKTLDHANGNLEKSGEKSGYKNSAKKQRSTEPKTVNAFQRVKVDAVEFADEKLQDNSYWAKDGAEIGYGAKAQEVLGQVRGRDFRHEKTKKKRGSYRGGLIDLQSHSVKFNYSDEE